MGAEGPKNIQLATEIADGWFPMFLSPYRMNFYDEALSQKKDDFEIAAFVQVNIDDDLQAALEPVKWMLGLYLGGMGSKGENFHKNLMQRMGFGDAAEEGQSLFLAGKQAEAIAAVPDELADEISLCGPADRVRERLQDWKKTPVTSLLVGRTEDPEADKLRLETIADVLM